MIKFYQNIKKLSRRFLHLYLFKNLKLYEVGLTPFLPFSGTDQLEGGISSIFRSKLTLFLHFCHEPTRGRTCPVVENAAAAVLAKIAQYENNFWTKISVNALKN